MAEMTNEQFREKVLNVLDEVGAFVNNSEGEPDIDQVEEVDDSISLPGVELDAQGKVVRYVMAKMTVFATYASNAAAAIQATWNTWFGADDNSGIRKTWGDWYSEAQTDWAAFFGASSSQGVQGEWGTLKSDAQQATQAANQAAGRVETAISGANTARDAANQAAGAANTAAQNADSSRESIEANETERERQEQIRQSQETTRQNNEQSRTTTFNNDHQTATSDHNQASQDHNRAETDHQTASDDHSQATADHNASVTATNEASNVDADLTGMTVTIINRNGVAKTVDLSFDFYASYPSVAAMNADVANIPKCSLVSIATTNKTDPENARIYQKRSDGTMIYVGDLDQASAEAWADWLENKKPEIDARIATADNDHTRAETDHSTATDDHSQAGDDHTRAESDHSTATDDHTQAGQDHTRAGSDHSTATDDHTQAGDDHTRAESDHSTATDDHSQAGQDHTRAGSDHSTATDDHTQAGQDHSRAESDHSTATDDHSQAGQDHSRAESDHQTAGEDHSASTQAAALATRQAEYAENVADHPPYIADGTEAKPGDVGYVYQWDYENQQYVRGIKISLDYDSMTDAEKQALAADVLAHIAFDDMPTQGSDNAVKSGGLYTALGGRSQLTFASIETCEDIIDELS